ncbi:NAD(P)/FAD-dependent oxidoreductase [Breznakiellaceae bacterium SP9]
MITSNDENKTKVAKERFDLIVVGAGPGGLTAAQYGARANLNVLVLERHTPGGLILTIEVLENFPGNIGPVGNPVRTGYELADDLRLQAETFGAHFETQEITAIEKVPEGDNGFFAVKTASGETREALAVIIATGSKHRTLDVPGEEHFFGRGVSYCGTCDGPFFRGKKLVVAGGGDSACDDALYLSRLASKVVLVHRRDRFRAQHGIADKVLHNPKIEVRFNTGITEIRGKKVVETVTLENLLDHSVSVEETAGVFVFIGSEPQIPEIDGLTLDSMGYIVTDQTMASSVAGGFAVGDVRSSPFRQVVVACGEGAIAAHCASVYIDFLRGQAYAGDQ